MGFAASGGNATRQLAAVRGVGPRRVSSWRRRRRRRDPRGLAPPRGTGVRRGAARPSAPRANQPDRPSLPMTRRQAALATMGLRVCHGRSQPRQALRRSAGRRVAPRAPRSRPPHSHRGPTLRCRQICAGTTSSCSNFPRRVGSFPPISTWRKSVPHPVTEYRDSSGRGAALLHRPQGRTRLPVQDASRAFAFTDPITPRRHRSYSDSLACRRFGSEEGPT